MTRLKTIQCLGAAAVLVFGSFAASAALAHGNSHYGKGSHGKRHKHKHKHKHHRYDDDDDRRYDDDDDDYRRRRHHNRDDDDDDHRRRDDDDDDGYGHRSTEVGVDSLAFHDLGGALAATLILDGVTEQAPVALRIEATAEVEARCAEPHAITRARPERVDLTTEGARTVTRVAGDPGLAAELQTRDAAALAEDLSGCGESVRVDQVRFLDARIDLSHAGEALTLLCTFLTPTDDGPIAAADFECVAL